MENGLNFQCNVFWEVAHVLKIFLKYTDRFMLKEVFQTNFLTKTFLFLFKAFLEANKYFFRWVLVAIKNTNFSLIR